MGGFLFCDEVCGGVCVVTGVEGRTCESAMTVGHCDEARPFRARIPGENRHAPPRHWAPRNPTTLTAVSPAMLARPGSPWMLPRPRLGSLLRRNSRAPGWLFRCPGRRFARLLTGAGSDEATRSFDFLQSQGLGAAAPTVENGPVREKGL